MALQIPTTAEMQNLYAMHSFVRPSAPQIHPHDSTKTPLFLVTLADVSCTATHDQNLVDVPKFRRKLQAGLKGLSYVGMVEPGFYVNVAPGTRWPGKKAV